MLVLQLFYNKVSLFLSLVTQAGFAFLEAGSVRSKNTTNILLKNTLDLCKLLPTDRNRTENIRNENTRKELNYI